MHRKVISHLCLLCLSMVLVSCEERIEVNTVKIEKTGSSQADEAIRDLADRLGFQINQISLVSEKSVTWRDGSLGCPKPGMMYTLSACLRGEKPVIRKSPSRPLAYL